MSSSQAAPVLHRGEVDDHRHPLVPAAGVTPRVLVGAEHSHSLEAVRVGDQQSPSMAALATNAQTEPIVVPEAPLAVTA